MRERDEGWVQAERREEGVKTMVSYQWQAQIPSEIEESQTEGHHAVDWHEDVAKVPVPSTSGCIPEHNTQTELC